MHGFASVSDDISVQVCRSLSCGHFLYRSVVFQCVDICEKVSRFEFYLFLGIFVNGSVSFIMSM